MPAEIAKPAPVDDVLLTPKSEFYGEDQEITSGYIKDVHAIEMGGAEREKRASEYDTELHSLEEKRRTIIAANPTSLVELGEVQRLIIFVTKAATHFLERCHVFDTERAAMIHVDEFVPPRALSSLLFREEKELPYALRVYIWYVYFLQHKEQNPTAPDKTLEETREQLGIDAHDLAYLGAVFGSTTRSVMRFRQMKMYIIESIKTMQDTTHADRLVRMRLIAPKIRGMHMPPEEQHNFTFADFKNFTLLPITIRLTCLKYAYLFLKSDTAPMPAEVPSWLFGALLTPQDMYPHAHELQYVHSGFAFSQRTVLDIIAFASKIYTQEDEAVRKGILNRFAKQEEIQRQVIARLQDKYNTYARARGIL